MVVLPGVKTKACGPSLRGDGNRRMEFALATRKDRRRFRTNAPRGLSKGERIVLSQISTKRYERRPREVWRRESLPSAHSPHKSDWASVSPEFQRFLTGICRFCY